MADERENTPQSRVRALLWNLRIDAATGELVGALSDRGIASVVLKGPALDPWYPRYSGRTYVDGDVWVSPEHHATAESVLVELGFTAVADERGLPAWWLEHASSWYRESDLGKIDLHRRLQGFGAAPARVWEVLSAQAVELTVGGVVARRLSDPCLALYVTLHATHHGAEDARGAAHLQAALDTVADPVWRAALELAGELGALEGFATGLRMMPRGAALAERIGVPDVRSVVSELLASKPPPVALGVAQLAAAHGTQRVVILMRKLVPPPGFIRHWWPPAARGRAMLAVGYAYRPLWLVRNLPGAYRAWREARRSARSSS